VKGLNFILSICIGSSFGEIVEGWASIAGGKLFCVVDGAKFFYVVDCGSMVPLLSTFEELVVTLNNLCNGLI
jgi:hypothetical protein